VACAAHGDAAGDARRRAPGHRGRLGPVPPAPRHSHHRPTDRLVVTGPGAIAATIEAFASGKALDWAEQVTVVATPQAHRQLAAAATAILNGTRPARILTLTDEPPAAIAGARLISSPDASPGDRDLATRLAGT
jgi:hypothetical protein